MFNLKGKVAVVAGGSGLIGKAIVDGLKKQGAEVINYDSQDGFHTENLIDLLPIINYNETDIFVNVTYPKSWKNHIETFLNATETVALALLWKGGSIINFASIYGVMGADYRIYDGTDMDMEIDYAAVKGGIIALSRALATKYARHNVRVNCVSPGGIYDNQPESFVKAYCNRVPMGRIATPDDIVGAVVFLASDASKYITGQNIIIDGGLSAW